MALLIGIMVGFVLALPPGGVAMVGVHLAIKRGWRSAAPFAIGSMIADITYACLAVFAAGAVSGTIASIAGRYPAVIVTVKGLIVGLLVIGGVAIVARRSPVILAPEDSAGAHESGTSGAFLLGLVANFTNAFVSPTFLAALALVVAQAGAYGILDGDRLGAVGYGAGFGIGNLLYMLLLMRLAGLAAKRLGGRRMLIAQRIIGVALAGAGAVLAVNLIAGLGA